MQHHLSHRHGFRVFADASQVKGIRWSPESKTLKRSEISEIIHSAVTLDFNEFVRAIIRVGEEVSWSCHLDLGADGEMELTKVDEYYAEPPASCSTAVHRWSLLETLSVVAEQEAIHLQQEIASCKEAVAIRISYRKKRSVAQDQRTPHASENFRQRPA